MAKQRESGLLNGGMDCSGGGLRGSRRLRGDAGGPQGLRADGGSAGVAAGVSISASQLQAIFPKAQASYLQQVANDLNPRLAACGLNTPLRLAHFFAQIREEAGPAMQATVENLNYSPDALKSLFSYYKQHPDEATQDGYAKDASGKIVRGANQQTIANKIYANRIGNGDIASGDGWKFRGRGFIQVTGRDNYGAIGTQYAKVYGAAGADFESQPDALAQFPDTLRSAVCFWLRNNLPKVADQGDTDAHVDAVTKVVNLHTTSYAARRENFKVARSVFK
jgi:putative chitinase